MSPTITVSELRKQPRRAAPAQLIDVRSASEYAAGHIPGAVNIPMEQMEARIEDLDRDLPIVLTCQTGKRARMTAGLLEPCRKDVAVLEGGTSAWIEAGHPVVVSARTRWSLERQVRLAVGVLVLTGSLLAATVGQGWVYLSAFAGLGLTLAGLTDFCPLAVLLGKMPWNGVGRCGAARPDADGPQCCS